MYSSTMCQMVNIPMCREGGERERERERGRGSILLSQAERAVIRWEEARETRKAGQLSYLQDNKTVSHVSRIELSQRVKSGRRGEAEPRRKGRGEKLSSTV